MNDLKSSNDTKLLGLEIVRFFAAFAVLIWHYQHFWYVGSSPQDFVRSEQPLYALFKLFYENGVYGVHIFWGISGYIFFWKYRSIISERKVGGWKFFVLRFSRLYPLHFITFVAIIGLQFLHRQINGVDFVYPSNSISVAISHLYMGSHWALDSNQTFNGPIWSVSLEVLVYGIFYFFTWLFKGGHLVSILLAIIGGVAYQLKLHPVFQCILLFYLGGIAATFNEIPLLRNICFQVQKYKISRYIPALVIFLMTMLVYRFGESHKSVIHVYIIVCLPFLLHLFARHVRIPESFAELVAVAGNITYASYLLHFPMQLTVKLGFDLGGSHVPKNQPLFFACYLIYVTLISILTYRLLEMPIQNWIRKRLLKS